MVENHPIHLLKEFGILYELRPIRDNTGGMKSGHMFNAWSIIKNLKPKTLIESGVWKGLGTWFFEKASPSTNIISIDPYLGGRQYISPAVDYRTEDFLSTDWSMLDKENSLVFFDDHQDCIPRLKKCKELGFKKIVIEDNYPWQQGDCYSPKKIFSNRDYIIDSGGIRKFHKKNEDDYNFLRDSIKTYKEMPPIFKPHKTRWGDDWNSEYPTPAPILELSSSSEYPVFFDERFDYTWICYLELK
jgi:hypothetical protein